MYNVHNNNTFLPSMGIYGTCYPGLFFSLFKIFSRICLHSKEAFEDMEERSFRVSVEGGSVNEVLVQAEAEQQVRILLYRGNFVPRSP
jgi:hypothetical protein